VRDSTRDAVCGTVCDAVRDAYPSLKPLSVLARLDDEPRRRQTARDVEPAQASPSSNRHVTNERELQPSTYGNCL